jgi:cysteine synthase
VEKVELLRRFGAEVEVVKTAAIANPNHYCRVAQRRAEEVRTVSTEFSLNPL